MFKAIKDNKIIAINETGYFPLLDHDGVKYDSDHTTADYVHVNGEYVLTSSAEAIEQKKSDVRAVRNRYLERTDKFMLTDYPITDEEREEYKQYREYLRDYPETENWWENPPKDFSTWKAPMESDNIEQDAEQIIDSGD